MREAPSHLDGWYELEVGVQVESSTVLVFQDRQWFGDPRLGAFIVTVDGRRVGVAPVRGRLVVRVQPGVHTLRIRQRWYRSPGIELTVAEGATVRLQADIPKHLGFAKRMARFMFKPSCALMLTRDDS
jgi:hypothetical protein